MHAKRSSINCKSHFQKSVPWECEWIFRYWLIKWKILDFRKMIIPHYFITMKACMMITYNLIYLVPMDDSTLFLSPWWIEVNLRNCWYFSCWSQPITRAHISVVRTIGNIETLHLEGVSFASSVMASNHSF